jgi:G:T/U-mismatch repair DNA glycosylase
MTQKDIDIEKHPLEPFLPLNSRVLFLGSFPPQKKRWCIDFFYPNFINDHWRIEGEIFFQNKNVFVDEERKIFRKDAIISFLKEKGIALYDTATTIRRLQNNASDKSLEIIEATNIDSLLAKIPFCSTIATTGEKATETICKNYGIESIPKVGCFTDIPNKHNADGKPIILYRLPSSSRAYPLSFHKKVEAYRTMFEHTGLL